MRTALPLLLLSLACLGLGGCGQKGPLFIPSDDGAPTTQSAPTSAPTPASDSTAPSAL